MACQNQSMVSAAATVRRSLRVLVLIFTLAGAWGPLAPPVIAQLQTADVVGRVVGPDGAPVRAARIVVFDALGAVVASAESDAAGGFALPQLSAGEYGVQAEAGALRSSPSRLSVRGRASEALTLRLVAHAQEKVELHAADTRRSDVRISLAGETLRRFWGQPQGRALQSALASTPGWTAEDNGLVHYRGSDDGLLYVIDGVPVYERIDPLFGLSPPTEAVGSVQILSGYIPPRYGLRSGAVIAVRSLARQERAFQGAVDASLGSFDAASGSALALAPIGAADGLMVSVSGERSDRFLDPVHPDGFHDAGLTRSGEGEYLHAGSRDAMAVRAGVARSRFEVPHEEEQEEAGQDQRQAVRQTYASLSWQRVWSPRTVQHFALYGRWTGAEVLPSAADTPLTIAAERSQRRLGGLVSVTHERGPHSFTAGLEVTDLRLHERFLFAVTDDDADVSEPALGFTPESPFDFRGRARGPQLSAYVEDAWRPRPSLALDFGVRFDHTRLLLTETRLSPRLGVSYRLPGGASTVRGSVNRFYQPPQSEFLLLASSEEARVLSPFAEAGGGSDVPGETQTAFEVGAERVFGRVRVDVAAWHRRMRNQADPNVLFGSNVIFANSVARGRAEGIDLRVEVPRVRRWSGYLSYTLSRVVQFGPINGGLFLEDDFPEIEDGTRFVPDHDQRHALAAALTFASASGACEASIAARYQSGPPLDLPDEAIDELLERPGVELVDFESERVKPRLVVDAMAALRLARLGRAHVSARVAVLNLFDRAYAYNFGNPFSGTHFGAPRTVSASLRVALE